MSHTTTTAADTGRPSADKLATMIREALTASREAGYQAGHYTSGLPENHHVEAAAREEAAVLAMWREFYDYVAAV